MTWRVSSRFVLKASSRRRNATFSCFECMSPSVSASSPVFLDFALALHLQGGRCSYSQSKRLRLTRVQVNRTLPNWRNTHIHLAHQSRTQQNSRQSRCDSSILRRRYQSLQNTHSRIHVLSCSRSRKQLLRAPAIRFLPRLNRHLCHRLFPERPLPTSDFPSTRYTVWMGA